MIRNSQNPRIMVEQLLNSNPQFSGIIPLINQNKSCKDAFYAAAKQSGVDPDIIVNLLRR